MAPAFFYFMKHQQTAKHRSNLQAPKIKQEQLSPRGHHYQSIWENEFPWVRCDNQSQNAYCTVCKEILQPEHSQYDL